MCQQLFDNLKQVKRYLSFSHVEMWFFSMVRIPVKHSNLHNKDSIGTDWLMRRQQQKNKLMQANGTLAHQISGR